MNLKEWLLDLAENNYVDWLDGEIAILPIKDDEDDNQEETETLPSHLFNQKIWFDMEKGRKLLQFGLFYD